MHVFETRHGNLRACAHLADGRPITSVQLTDEEQRVLRGIQERADRAAQAGDRYAVYESRKAMLEGACLAPEEYERRLSKLAEELGV